MSETYVTKSKNCTACTACQWVCPKRCITMARDELGFSYPMVNQEICIKCGLCKKVCPLDFKKEERENRKIPKAYGAYAENKIRETSASGGIFPLLARWIIEQGGWVYGARYEKDCHYVKVIHDGISRKEDILPLCNVKYAQSDLQDVFMRIKKNLQEEKKILFVGTPCQTAGLISFLKVKMIKTDGLFTVSTICHGVPSPKAFQCYMEHIRRKENLPAPPSICMRDKISGWSNYSASLSFTSENGKKKIEQAYHNSYMRAFMSNLTLRPSCSVCKYKGYDQPGDIVIGDFWGVEQLHKELDDNKGTSAILILTDKGEKIFDEIQKDKELIRCQEISYEEVGFKNRNLLQAAKENEKRDQFLKTVNEDNFELLVEEYVPKEKVPFLGKLYRIYQEYLLRKRLKSL